MNWPEDYIGKVIQGDCLEVMQGMPNGCVDSIVTDSPYGLKFMGKKWDCQVPSVEIWQEGFRVLKPGGHLLSFFGTRTYHRGVVNIEDAGFEIRDQIGWVYGSGFPKSLDVSKAIDKQGGKSLGWFIDYILKVADDRGISRKELTMLFPSKNNNLTGWLWNKQYTQGITLEQYNKIKDFLNLPFDSIQEAEREIIGKNKNWGIRGAIPISAYGEFNITAPATDEARQWNGWGTGLKPAWEPIVVARKPLDGTVAENVLKHGTGAMNIDGCRVGTEFRNYKGSGAQPHKLNAHSKGDTGIGYMDGSGKDLKFSAQGRWPANVIHDGSEEVLAEFPQTTSGAMKRNVDSYDGNSITGFLRGRSGPENQHGDSGSAARFFYCAKVSKSERGEGNNHPTVKPIALMRYLCRLVTPPYGVILDLFAGSGSTGVAATLEGFEFICIDNDIEICEIARKRVAQAQEQPDLL